MYKLIRESSSIRRLTDGACLPADEGNADFQAFTRWREGWTETLEDGTEVAHPPHEPESADPVAPPSRDELDAAEAKSYAKLVALRGMTPAQVQAWVEASVTNLAQAKDAIKTLAVAVSILARRI